MPRAFISHAPADRPFVESVMVPLLATQGVQPCYSGDDASDPTEVRAVSVRDCDYVVVVMSPGSARSRWVRRQSAAAFEAGKPILPVVVEDCDAAAFLAALAALPRVDFRTDPSACERFLAFFQVMTPPAPATFTNGLGMKFALVPHGGFWMGGGGGKPGTRRVEVPRDFYLGVYPVTQEQWLDVMGTNPSYFSRVGTGRDAVRDVPFAELKLFPVECVSWEDAQEFLGKLNAREKGPGWTFRLPTEAEWEYACRAAASTPEDCSYDFYTDAPAHELSSTRANFDGSYPYRGAAPGPYLRRTCKVGSYGPNRLGLFDMHGNVGEWCDDLYEGGPARVVRGGGWYFGGSHSRASHRNYSTPGIKDIVLGFRVARVQPG